jgi:hypothetical protein
MQTLLDLYIWVMDIRLLQIFSAEVVLPRQRFVSSSLFGRASAFVRILRSGEIDCRLFDVIVVGSVTPGSDYFSFMRGLEFIACLI